MALKTANKRNPNFSMSSLTDIIFLLLIFFMLTSSFVTPNALNLILPSSNSQTTVKQTLAESINSDLAYFIGTDEVNFDDLEALIQQEVNKDTVNDKTIILNCDKSVPIGEAVKVINIIKNMDLDMVLATSPVQE